MPAKSMMIVSSGIAIISAMMRVTARYLNASTALASSASICSDHFHRAQFGADAGANPAGDEQRGGERSGFANHRNRQPGRNHRLGAEPFERRSCVHRQHDADRQPGRADERS